MTIWPAFGCREQLRAAKCHAFELKIDLLNGGSAPETIATTNRFDDCVAVTLCGPAV